MEGKLIKALIALLAAIACSCPAAVAPSRSVATTKAISICVFTRLDPLSYRPSPKAAKEDKRFLEQLEGQFSMGLVDAIIKAIIDLRGRPVSGDARIIGYSEGVITTYGIPSICQNGYVVRINTSYQPNRAIWILNVVFEGKGRQQFYRYSGPDKYISCSEVCDRDAFGGASQRLNIIAQNVLKVLVENKDV